MSKPTSPIRSSFFVFANDNARSFPSRTFATLIDALRYGDDSKRPYTVALPSGAIAAAKTHDDGDVKIYV